MSNVAVRWLGQKWQEINLPVDDLTKFPESGSGSPCSAEHR